MTGSGRHGADQLRGGSGDDVIRGEHNDQLFGGTGSIHCRAAQEHRLWRHRG